MRIREPEFLLELADLAGEPTVKGVALAAPGGVTKLPDSWDLPLQDLYSAASAFWQSYAERDRTLSELILIFESDVLLLVFGGAASLLLFLEDRSRLAEITAKAKLYLLRQKFFPSSISGAA